MTSKRRKKFILIYTHLFFWKRNRKGNEMKENKIDNRHSTVYQKSDNQSSEFDDLNEYVQLCVYPNNKK